MSNKENNKKIDWDNLQWCEVVGPNPEDVVPLKPAARAEEPPKKTPFTFNGEFASKTLIDDAAMPSIQKKREKQEQLEILGNELGLAGGFGNYATNSKDIPARGMDKAAARNVLKLLNLGCKNVNFSMEMIGDDRPYECPRERRYCVEVTEGEYTLHMKIYADDSIYYPHMDTIDFEIRKHGDTKFKFRADMQFYTMKRRIMSKEDHSHNSNNSQDEEDWQGVSDELHLRDFGWRRGISSTYYVRVNVTVL